MNPDTLDARGDARLGLPIAIGVSGHLDLADGARVAALLAEEINWLADAFPNAPLIAYSSLAEGADRIFARVALEQGFELFVPLPFPQEEYEQDFPDTVDEFRSLCKKATRVFVLADSVLPLEGMGTDDAIPKQHRNLLYTRAGVYIAEHAQVLFAIWDFGQGGGLGGTADIVEFHRHGTIQGVSQAALFPFGRHPAARIRFGQGDVSRIGTLCEVHARRAAHVADSQGPSLDRKWRQIAEPKLRFVDRYDARLRMGRRPEAESEAELRKRLGLENAAVVETPTWQDFLRLRDTFRRADALAEGLVTSSRRWYAWVFLTIGLAALFHELYSDGQKNHWLLLLNLICLTGIGLFVRTTRKSGRSLGAIEDRAIAEGLRVQEAWLLAGLPDAVAHHYLRRDSHHLAGVRTALMSASPTCSCTQSRELVDAVSKHWVEGQCNFFVDRIERLKATLDRIGATRKALYYMGTGIAMLLCLYRFSSWRSEGDESPLRVADTAIGLLPALAATAIGYVEFSACEDDLREYERCKSLFKAARLDLSHANDVRARQTVIHALGIEALYENATWTLLHMTRVEGVQAE